MDVMSNQIVAFCPSKIISIASLKGEDKDAWKYYLKKANIKLALESCKNSRQKALVNGTHAEQLFMSGSY